MGVKKEIEGREGVGAWEAPWALPVEGLVMCSGVRPGFSEGSWEY